MNRNERKNIHDLFRRAHAARDGATLPIGWNRRVMADIRNTDASGDALSRLAPRFTLAATTLSAIGIVVGSWAVFQLTEKIGDAYVSQLTDLASNAWTML